MFSARHRVRYLWAAMKVGRRNPASATRRMKVWSSGGVRAVGDGDGPLEAKVVGQGPEADDGYFEGHLAAEGVDARPNLVHWLDSPLAGTFSLPLICSHFSSRLGGCWRAGIGARP